jgi:predicted ester cyclase
MMQGFDAEFVDLDHYIRVITDRIWECRRLDDIKLYYAADCAVETPAGVSIGVEPVIAGTRATLAAFPDRRLLAEDVVISGDAHGGFLSSHRIFSPMTHAGPGSFGAPTGRTVYARTIADCVCINNRIVHEWLVRDQGAIARQLGRSPRELAQVWLNEARGWRKPAMPPAPAPYVSFIDHNPVAQAYAAAYQTLWQQGQPTALQASHHAQAISALPGGHTACNAAALEAFWAPWLAAMPHAQFALEHLVANPKPGRAGAGSATIAMRWRVRATHQAPGVWGQPTGKAVEILGICHADVEAGRVLREWVLIDEVATWMQMLEPSVV